MRVSSATQHNKISQESLDVQVVGGVRRWRVLAAGYGVLGSRACSLGAWEGLLVPAMTDAGDG